MNDETKGDCSERGKGELVEKEDHGSRSAKEAMHSVFPQKKRGAKATGGAKCRRRNVFVGGENVVGARDYVLLGGEWSRGKSGGVQDKRGTGGQAWKTGKKKLGRGVQSAGVNA